MSFSYRGPLETRTPETDTADPGPSFDALDYALHLRKRGGWIAAACGVAMALTFVACLLMPKRYTSTASIIIEPPAGTDPRTFTAISPIYLESLKTYETFALSGALFQTALDKFHLRDLSGGGSIEGIKARVLKVSKLRDTKVLQISVTLEDPKQAQAMAQFMAEESVKLINSVSRANGRGQLDDLQQQADSAHQRLQQAQAELSKANESSPVATLRTELESMIELQYSLRRELYQAEASSAEYNSPGIKLRVESLAKRSREMDEAVKAKSKAVSEASTRIERLESERRTAQGIYDATIKRLQESNSWAGSSGERLQVIDPGIIAERPSEPRTMLYTAMAGALAFLGCIAYLSIGYGFRRS